MSKYTTEVRYICEKAAGLEESKGYSDVDEIISDAIPSVFSYDFPIFDENYRNVICTKILRHYYTREIGFETVGLWKLKMQTKLNEIMPYYNQLYESELIKFNPLYDVDLETRHEGEKFGTESGKQNITAIHNESLENNDSYSINRNTSGIGIDNVETTGNENNIEITSIDKTQSGNENRNTNSSNVEVGRISKDESATESKNSSNTNVENNRDKNYDLYSDTPQGALDGVEAETYLTNARKVTNEKNNINTGNINESGNSSKDSTESGNKTVIGSGNESNSSSITSGEDGEKTGNINRNENERSERFDNRSETETNSGTRRSTNEGNKAESLNKENSITSTEAYTLHVIGKQAGVSFSKMLKEFRDTFLNIDMEIIKELAPLFMNLW